MYNIPINRVTRLAYKPTPLKMKLALEIRVG